MMKRMAIRQALVRVETNDGKIYYGTGNCHDDCYGELYRAGIYARTRPYDYKSVTEGFQTTTGEFVDRKRAYMIANGNNQLSTTNRDGILQSWMIKNYIDEIHS